MEDGIINQFLTQYKLWVLDGAPETQFYQNNEYHFSTHAGLCGNLTRFANKVFADVEDYHLFVDAALSELAALFQADGLDEDFPFGGEEEYLAEQLTRTFHFNPTRMVWVDRQLGIA